MILNLSNFIYSLLLENETVIIPGFGTFLSTYKPAEISETEIKPPSKEISFTQQIKNNDGLLVEIIARKAKISQINALKRIEKARENMLYELDKGESVILENIGKLFYNENNEIQFISSQEDNLLLDSFGFETTSLADSIENIAEIDTTEAEVEESVESFGETIILNETDIVNEIESQPASQPLTEVVNTDVQHKDIPEVEAEARPKQEIDSESFKFKELNPASGYEESNKKRKIGWYWIFLILIPISIGGYFVINNSSKKNRIEINAEQNTTIEQQGIQIETIAPPDSIANHAEAITETDSALNVDQGSTLPSEISKYYLVGGGFKEEENVEKYIALLKEKGINGFALGKKGRVFLVGIESFDTETEAMKSLNEYFKVNPDWKIWIYKK